jgi:hypothetical protein
VLGLGLLGTGARILSIDRLYRSKTTITYEHGVLAGEPDPPRDVGQRLAEMLTSRERLQRLIEEMHLYPTVVTERGLTDAVDEMRSDVHLSVRGATTFDVSYDADDGDRARAVLKRLVDSVIDEDTQRRQHEVETARRTLDAERHQAEQDLETKEARLAAFSVEHPRLAAKSGVPADEPNRGSEGAAEVASLELRSAELGAMLARSSGRPGPVSAASSAEPAVAAAPPAADPAVVAARAEVAADLLVAERDLDEKQTRLPYQHPDVTTALRRVDEARAALRRADEAVAASAAAASAPAAAKAVGGEKLASVRRAMASVQSRIATLKAQNKPSRQSDKPVETTEEQTAASDTAGTRLALDVSEARERRRQLEGRLFRAQLLSTLGAAGQGGGLVVSGQSYRPSRPIAAPRFKVGLVGASMSALLALLALMVAGRLDGRLYEPGDVARALGRDVVVVSLQLGVKLAGRQPVRITNTGA